MGRFAGHSQSQSLEKKSVVDVIDEIRQMNQYVVIWAWRQRNLGLILILVK